MNQPNEDPIKKKMDEMRQTQKIRKEIKKQHRQTVMEQFDFNQKKSKPTGQ